MALLLVVACVVLFPFWQRSQDRGSVGSRAADWSAYIAPITASDPAFFKRCLPQAGTPYEVSAVEDLFAERAKGWGGPATLPSFLDVWGRSYLVLYWATNSIPERERGQFL
jgi:hypothetical protein